MTKNFDFTCRECDVLIHKMDHFNPNKGPVMMGEYRIFSWYMGVCLDCMEKTRLWYDGIVLEHLRRVRTKSD